MASVSGDEAAPVYSRLTDAGNRRLANAGGAECRITAADQYPRATAAGSTGAQFQGGAVAN
jgi:hypothetical protein